MHLLICLCLKQILYLLWHANHFANNNNRRPTDFCGDHSLMQLGQWRINLTLLWQRCILNQNRGRSALSTGFQ